MTSCMEVFLCGISVDSFPGIPCQIFTDGKLQSEQVLVVKIIAWKFWIS